MDCELNPKLLLVDDDVDLRICLREFLELEGYEIREAGNGLEALRCLEDAFAPCAILLDLRMPVMNGFQFYLELQRHPSWSDIPVVVLSAAQESETCQVPARAVLHKPFEPESLFEELMRLCPLPRPALAEVPS